MQQLMYSFEGSVAPAEILDGVRRGEITAICLFGGKNVSSAQEAYELAMSLRRAAQEGGFPPPLIGIDQEGGQLIAIANGATELPGNMALGATRSPALAEQAGRVTARELLAMGINMNFAPCLDVNVNPANPVIGIRSFGDSPTMVAELGAAYIRGLQNEGVLATAKHFPGHGDTQGDSHYDLPIVAHSMLRMDEIELVPFREAIKANVGSIMTAHVLFQALDDKNPATISPRVLTGLLRKEMKYQGLILTDAMDMWAVAQFGAEYSVTHALQAGADLVMLGHLPDQTKLGEIVTPLANPESLARVRAAQSRTAKTLPPFDVIRSKEHLEIAQQIADASITLIRDDGRLPLHLNPDDRIAVITPKPTNLTPADTSAKVRISLPDAIRQRHPNTDAYEVLPNASDAEVAAILEAVESAQLVIVGTINAAHDESQMNLVQALYQRQQSPIIAVLRTPYDLAVFPMIQTCLCSYGIRQVTMEAVARVMFGEIEATGVLPCAIPGVSLQAG